MTRIFELGVCGRSTSCRFFLLTLDLLDHIKAGLFDLVCLLHSASTWSRLRHSDAAGQPPLRTRAFPVGLSNLAPPSLQKIRSDNRILESISWCACAEQTLLCTKPTSLFVVFPEDLGGHSRDGPTSVWSLREFQVLQEQSETCRGAGFLCQLGQGRLQTSHGSIDKHRETLRQATQGMALPHQSHRRPSLQRPSTKPLPMCPTASKPQRY